MSISNPNLPKSILALRVYTAQMFLHDLLAGVTVGLVALPLAMAFGIASGVTPQAGLYTAVVAGFLISALGGSRTQIGGPTGAFVVIVAGIVAHFGMSGLAMVTLMAGIILLVMGFTGLGAAVKFIPRMVVVGFTNGIAILIASTQIKDFFGLRTPAVPSEFLPRMMVLGRHFTTINRYALALGLGTLAILILLPRLTRRVPASIVAVLACTAVSVLFRLPVETIGSRFGGIPRGFPPFAIPNFHAEHILPLIPAAFTVAMLAALESMLSAVVADGMTGDRHNSNVELVAQGFANIVSPLFGGIPATGAIARTATNIRAGARSPVSGMIHALTLLLHSAGCCAVGELHPAHHAGGCALCRGVQHGRVARDRRHSASGLHGHLGLAGHVCAHSLRRSHGCRRRRPGACGAALYPPGCRHHDRLSGHRRVHSRRLAARLAGPHRSALRHRCCAFTAHFFGAPRKNSSRPRSISKHLRR